MFFESKTANETKAYTFTPALAEGDAVDTFTVSVSGVTLGTYEALAEDIVVTLSGGTAGQTATILFTVETGAGETLEQTVYLPIIASTAVTADTAQDYVAFALRKIVGIGEDASADELAHGLEILNGLIARLRAGGADIGAAYPVTSSTVIYCPEWAVSALRYNLLIECAPLFGVEPSPLEYDLARRGLQLIKHKNLPDKRAVEFY